MPDNEAARTAAATADLDWLEAARSALNADPAFRRLGSADFRLGLVLGGEARLITFQAFQIADVAPAHPADMRDADLLLEMAPDAWNAYLRRRASADAPSLLALDLQERLVSARSPSARLLLERYNGSIQALLDKGASLTAGASS